jgi:ATP-binding protein involved in chromosome partitioning
MQKGENCAPATSCQSCESVESCDADAQRKHMDNRLAHSLSLIKHRVVVMSGKGGVGKSTVAVNLALVLAQKGKKVGLLDGDIHGPDTPKMFGLDGDRPEASPSGLEPLVGPRNVKVMSMGFLLPDDDTPVAWRGPMKHTLFQQFLADVQWGELDFLVVDLPPGTGDEPLSVGQLLGKPLNAVIVTTPQDVALLDSRKSVTFAKSLEMDVLGIVENMSGLKCPHCGESIDLFKTGGGQRAAYELGVPFLGSIPIDPHVVWGGDSGLPVTVTEPDSTVSQAFSKIVATIEEAIVAGS